MRILVKFILYLISIPVFSRIYGRITKMRRPRFLVRAAMDFFIDKYGIDMDEYEGEVADYDSLHSLFIRKFDPSKRDLKRDENCFLSPCDGLVSGIDLVHEDSAFQVKGTSYRISELINSKEDFSEGWYVITIYLSPSNYHRFHFPVSGRVEGYAHMRGRLYPVNSLGLNRIGELFVKNERVIIRMTKKKMPVYLVPVGATFVGSIRINFIDRYKRDAKWKDPDYNAIQMDEMGRFELGSTIICLIPEKIVSGKPLKTPGPVFTGERLLSLK